MKAKTTINRHSIALSNLDKIWFPKSKITKGDILNYYYKVADYFTVHIKDHLITLQRFPEGIKGESFYQKNAPTYFPSWIKTVPVEKEGGQDVHYVICNNAATLIYLVNQGSLVIHSWLSRYNKLQYPDRMVFDLDPSINDFNAVRKAALLLKDILNDLKLPSFVMTTGSRGLHVWVPLKRVHTFDQVAAVTTAIAQKMIKKEPNQFTLEVRKNKRGKKIFIDTLRNRYSATSVAPYSVRAHEKAPVATPLAWKEVEDHQLTSQKFTINNIMDRLNSIKNPWAQLSKKEVSLKRLYKKLGVRV